MDRREDAVVGARYRLADGRSLSLADGVGRVDLAAGTVLLARSTDEDRDHGFGSESYGNVTIAVFEIVGGPRRGTTVQVIYRVGLPAFLARCGETDGDRARS